MSLLVSIIAKDEEFDTKELENQILEPRNEIFGGESCRQTLWGHPVIATLGCEIIYGLKEF